MKIIAGKFRGKKLKTPEGKGIRPTTGRFRESIFSALDFRLGGFPGKKAADVFAGTGALGLEALSRGAEHVTFIEKHRESLTILRENIAILNVGNKSNILSLDASALPRTDAGFDIIFMDPPYGKSLAGPALKKLVGGDWLLPKGIIVLECDKRDVFDLPEGLEIKRTLKQGHRLAHFIGFS